MKYGVSYYPELIDESEWKKDLTRMREAGLTIIRTLDFAWTAFEPREGKYRWDWLDRFLDAAQEEQFEVILATPTASPPAWLAAQYPEIMVILPGGEKRTFGGRRDVSICSTIYRDYAVQLAAVLGKRYGRHPAVVGWQIDNELMGPEFAPMEDHNPEATWRFRRWLHGRYTDVEAINQAWYLKFWNQEFSDWGEITTPMHRRCCLGWKLDYSRFLTDMNVDFIELQRDALRKVIEPRQFISHNSTATLNRGIDHRLYTRVQDEVGWDAYHCAAECILPETATALVHDLFRGFLNKPFWVYETNPGTLPFTSASLAEMHARGAKAALFWHWRQHRGNVEQGCLAICDFAGRPVPDRIRRIEEITRRPELQPQRDGRLPRCQAALYFSPDCVRAETESSGLPSAGTRPDGYLAAVLSMYAALRQIGVAVDIIDFEESLDNYQFVVIPALKLMSRDTAARIVEFVQKGGVILGSGPLAMMDLHGVYYPTPGELLAEAFGFTIRGPLRIPEKPQIVMLEDKKRFTAESTAESLELTGARVEGIFEGGVFDGNPAVTSHSCGNGHAFYAATTSRTLSLNLAKRALPLAGIPFADQPWEEIGVYPEPGGNAMWYFNYGRESRTVLGVEIPAGDFRKVQK